MKNITKKNFSFFIHKPFTIFEIEDFLPDDEFSNLLNSFPSETNFNTEVNNIKTFSNKSENDKENLKNFLLNNNYWDIFFKKIKSKKFINSAFYTSIISNLKSRGLGSIKKWTGLTSRISENQFEEFKNDCEIFHKSIFKQNKLIGFFRNDISIHSVTTSSSNINDKRRALYFFIKY